MPITILLAPTPRVTRTLVSAEEPISARVTKAVCALRQRLIALRSPIRDLACSKPAVDLDSHHCGNI